MSDSKTPWTAGPWYPGHMVDPDSKCQCRSILAENAYMGSIAEITIDNGLSVGEGGNDAPPLHEAIANARLIASAPELAEALERLHRATDRLLGNINEFGTCTDVIFVDGLESALIDARLALRKAKGEQT